MEGKVRWVAVSKVHIKESGFIRRALKKARVLLSKAKERGESVLFADFKKKIAEDAEISELQVHNQLLRFYTVHDDLPPADSMEWFLKLETLIDGKPTCIMYNPYEMPELVALAPPLNKENAPAPPPSARKKEFTGAHPQSRMNA